VERSDAADRCRRGGQAGASCVAKLRSEGFTGAITLIGEEHAPPYQRPPLSKAYLLGEMALERLYLRPESYYAENGIELMLDTTVQAIDRSDRQVIASGHAIPYDALVLATGRCRAACRGPSAASLDGVHVVRTLKDVDEMAPEIVRGPPRPDRRRRVYRAGGGGRLPQEGPRRHPDRDGRPHPRARGLPRDLRMVPRPAQNAMA
jgi:3-phenylpropionate/trans-cinnamate dioxygenase ferredoxin reductase subunit